MNKVILGGYIGNDPEARYTQTNNTMVVSFSVGTREAKDKTEWHKVVAIGKQAEFISKYFKKGSYISLTGHLQTRNYDDKDGRKVYITEVVTESAEFGGSKKENTTNTQQEFTPISEDDLPF